MGVPSDPSNRNAFVQMTRLMYQMARLAFQTDSTRCVTLLMDGNNSPAIKVASTRITDGYHNLSHHGMNKDKLPQLDAIDREQMRLLGELIRGPKSVEEAEGVPLKNTVVMYGNNFGDANKHRPTCRCRRGRAVSFAGQHDLNQQLSPAQPLCQHDAKHGFAIGQIHHHHTGTMRGLLQPKPSA